jgi:hypothetical protein
VIGAFYAGAAYPLAGPPLSTESSAVTVYRSRTYRFASHDFTTYPTDTPANSPIYGRLKPFRFRSEIGVDDATGRFAGASPIGVGEVSLANADGALNTLVRQTVTDGQPVRVKVGVIDKDQWGRRVPWEFSNFGAVLEATAEQWQVGQTDPSLQLRDSTMKLQRPVQPYTYSGAGGFEGSPELGGLTKVICYGQCRNITPALIDPNRLIYQFSDLPALAVDAVRDRGVRLLRAGNEPNPNEFLSASVDPGYFLTCLPMGCFRLGDVPAGAVTADVRGADKGKVRSFFTDGAGFSDQSGFANSISNSYTDTTAGIITRLIIDRGIGKNAQIETTSFAQMQRDQPAPIGIYLPPGDPSSCLQVIDRLAKGAGMFFGQEPGGRYQLRRFEAPPDTTWRSLDDSMIVEMASAELPYRVPPAQWAVTYARNWTVQRPEDLSQEGATEADYSFSLRPHQVATSLSVPIRTAFRTAQMITVDAYFASITDAAAEAARLLTVYALGRALYNMRLPLSGLSYQRGNAIMVTSKTPGFEAGKAVIVVGTDISTATREAVLTVFA